MAERNGAAPSASPWPLRGPRKPSVPSHVQKCEAQCRWLSVESNPVVAHDLGGPRASGFSRRTRLDRAAANQV